MKSLYNTQSSLARDLSKFFKNVSPKISKPHLKIIPYVILGMIQSESVVTSDIVKKLKGDFSLSLIKESISYAHNLFKDKKCNLIFLADRWFNFREIMQHIDSLGCPYCIRTKSNISIEIDNFEDAGLIATIADIEPFLTKSNFFDSVRITSHKFQTKLAVSKTDSHNEPFLFSLMVIIVPFFLISFYKKMLTKNLKLFFSNSWLFLSIIGRTFSFYIHCYSKVL